MWNWDAMTTDEIDTVTGAYCDAHEIGDDDEIDVDQRDIEAWADCPRCDGTGYVDRVWASKSEPDREKCPVCRGEEKSE